MTNNNRFYPVSMPALTGKELEYVTDAMKSGWISSLGAYVTRFEAEFAAFCGVNHAVCVANGTVALHLAIHALHIGKDDEVIMPDLSFVATANAVLMAGAKPVFCDVSSDTLCIDPDKIEALITERTRAIMPVHLYGHPADMTRILEIAQRYELKVIEDSAEAHGSAIGEKRVGSFGNCGTFSFYANKNMTTGEGGMITTNDAELARDLRNLRDHAMSSSKRYWHERMGFNYRMTNLQAAIGCAQLEQIENFLVCRRSIYNGYAQRLSDLPGIKLNRECFGTTNSFWMVCLEVEGIDSDERNKISAELKLLGVDTRPYFYPMSDMPYLENAFTPVAHKVSSQGLNLPTYVSLTEGDLDFICAAIRSVLENVDRVIHV